MNKDSLKDIIYGGIQELVRRREHYYYSPSGQKYSFWTEQGQTALDEFMNYVGYVISETEAEDLKQRSKDMVIKELKGDNI